MSEIRQAKANEHVVFTDSRGVERSALLTIVHGESSMVLARDGQGQQGQQEYHPSVNLVFVTGDPSKTDPYGLQIERASSVVHRNDQGAHGNFWDFA